jgi:hypothetical protein
MAEPWDDIGTPPSRARPPRAAGAIVPKS